MAYYGSEGFGPVTRAPSPETLDLLYSPRRLNRRPVLGGGQQVTPFRPAGIADQNRSGPGFGGLDLPAPPPTQYPPGYSSGAFPSYDPRAQFGGGRLDDFLGQSQLYNLLSSLIGQGGRAGAFDPTGGGAVFDSLRDFAEQQSGAAQRSAVLGAQARDVDPSQIPFLSTQAQIGAQQGISDIMGRGRFELAHERERYVRSLLDQLLGVGFQRNLGKLGAQLQPKPGFGDYLAPILGRGVGMLLGPAGPIGGSLMGGGGAAGGGADILSFPMI